MGFFAGIEKSEQPPVLRVDQLKEMLLNKCVTITVKGINGNVNLVTVEKLWENDSLKVAVTKGLVKSSSAESLRTERQGTQLLQITEFEELWAHEIPKWLLLLKTVENSTSPP